MAIDPARLPGRCLLDSSVLIPALRGGPEDGKCVELFNALVAHRREVLIPAPTLAEVLRGDPGATLPRVRTVRVVPFDQIAAERLGLHFPSETLKQFRDELGGVLDYWKYDALIVAIAVRQRVDCFVGRDERQLRLAKTMGLDARTPDEFEALQMSLLTPT